MRTRAAGTLRGLRRGALVAGVVMAVVGSGVVRSSALVTDNSSGAPLAVPTPSATAAPTVEVPRGPIAVKVTADAVPAKADAVPAKAESAPARGAPNVAGPARAVKAATVTVPAYTSWPALNEAIARIPNYRPGVTQWVVENKGGWGATDLSTRVVYISPSAPVDKLFSIVTHEWGHALSLYIYGGSAAAEQAADAFFGGSGEYGLELEADCMAIEQGATWTNYTSCPHDTWRAGARALLAGHRLPGL